PRSTRRCRACPSAAPRATGYDDGRAESPGVPPRTDGRLPRLTWRARCAAGPRLLGATDARSAERSPLPARADAPHAPDRREAESARLRAEGVDGRHRLSQAAGPMVDRVSGLQAETWTAARGAAGTEVDQWVGDEAGRETHSHGRHCTRAVIGMRGSRDRGPRPRSRVVARRTGRHLREHFEPSQLAARVRWRAPPERRPSARPLLTPGREAG